MTEAAIAAQVHQTLDVDGLLTAQIAFDREFRYLLAQALKK